jgi:predicted ATPase
MDTLVPLGRRSTVQGCRYGLVVTPLSDGDLGQLIGDALDFEQDRAHPLTQRVQEKTGDNPLFAIHFLHTLEDESLLVFDHADGHQERSALIVSV